MKTKRVKALKMYGTKYTHPDNRGIITPIYNGKIPGLSQVPVYLLPADAESYERMVEQAVDALANADANDRCSYDDMVRAVAKSWGITAPKKKGTQ